MGLSLTEIKNRMISDYGQIDHDMGALILRDDIDRKRLDRLLLHPTAKTQVTADNRLYRCYLVMRGSHTYDSREMAHLIEETQEEARGWCSDVGRPGGGTDERKMGSKERGKNMKNKTREQALTDFIADVTVTHTWELLTREERVAFIKIMFGIQNDLCGTYRQRYETCKHMLLAFLVGAAQV